MTPLRAASDAAAERLYDHLRRDRGMAYAPYADYATVGAGLAHVALGSDCSDEDAPGVLEEIWRIAGELAEGGATEEELERYRRGSLRPRARRGDPRAPRRARHRRPARRRAVHGGALAPGAG